MCMVVISAIGGQALCLLNLVCDIKHVTLMFVKCHAQPTDMQIFKFRSSTQLLISHVLTIRNDCYGLINFFTIVKW